VSYLVANECFGLLCSEWVLNSHCIVPLYNEIQSRANRQRPESRGSGRSKPAVSVNKPRKTNDCNNWFWLFVVCEKGREREREWVIAQLYRPIEFRCVKEPMGWYRLRTLGYFSCPATGLLPYVERRESRIGDRRKRVMVTYTALYGTIWLSKLVRIKSRPIWHPKWTFKNPVPV